MYSTSHPKFQKKYSFLEATLTTFLDWREKTNSRTSQLRNPESLIKTSSSTLDQEFILMKKIPYKNLYGSSKGKSGELLQSNLFEFVNEACLPKSIFSQKPSFLKYWLIPFISFSVFLPKSNSNNSVPPVATLMDVNSNVKQSTKAISELNFQGLFADQKLKSHYQHVLEHEKHELSMLANYYNQTFERDLNNFDNQKPLNHFSTKILENQYRNSATFNWKWFEIENSKDQKIQLLANKRLLQNSHHNSIATIPFKINPNFTDRLLENKSENCSKSIPLNYSTPIESYKKAQYLLDQLTLDFVGSTDILFTTPKTFSKSTNLLNIIDKLDESIRLSLPSKSLFHFEHDSPNQAIDWESANVNTKKSLHHIGRVLKNQFLQTYLSKLLKNEENLNNSSELLNKINDYRQLLSVHSKKEFYNNLKQTNFKNLNLNSFKTKRLKLNLQNSFDVPNSIPNIKYNEFYLNSFLNLFQDFKMNIEKINSEKLIQSVNPIVYELLLLKNLKNLSTKSNVNIEQDLTPNLISTEFDKFLTVLKINSSDQSLLNKTIIQLQRPFQMVLLENLKEPKLNNKEKILLFKKSGLDQDKFLTFIKQNDNLNRYSGWLVSSGQNKANVDSTKHPFFMVQLWDKFNHGYSISQMSNPIFQWNFLQVLTEIVSRLNTFQNSFTGFQSRLLLKTETEWLLNSEIISESTSFAPQNKNVKVQVIKKPNYLIQSTTDLTQDRRKMEKLLRAYLSSKMSISKLNRDNNDFKFYQTKEKKLVSVKRLKLRLQKNLTTPISINLTPVSPLIMAKKSQPKNLIPQVQLNPHNLLKRIGFVFLNKWEQEKKFGDLERVQVFKAQQKKHRRKKQNLETRRRKKRKRWYPRPTWLRLQMYQDFLRVRHFPKRVSPILKLSSKNAFRMNSVPLKQYIYRQNQQKWGQMSTNQANLEKRNIQLWNLTKSLPISANQDFYKISNKTMNEFQRLCWKSSWLRSNLNVYTDRIQRNLKKIKESQKIFSSNVSFQKFCASWFGFNESDLNTLTSRTKMQKPQIPSLDWYLNYRTSFDFPELTPSFSLFQHQNNSKNYDQVLSKRISNIIKNVKINLNKSGELQAYSFIQGRRKLEKLNKPSQIQEFVYDLTSSGIPLSPLNYLIDNLLIPSNQISRLRMGWALNRTHGFTFKENNDIQKVWQYVKYRDQSKSNKTKKFIRKSLSHFFPKDKFNLSFEKTRNIQTKLSWHRTNHYFSKRLFQQDFSIPTNSSMGKRFFSNSRDLKFYLKTQVHSNLKLPKSFKTQTNDLRSLPLFQIQKPQKNEIHFWWSTQTSLKSFSPMSLISFDTVQGSTDNSPPVQSWVFVNTIWICAFLLHLSILFSLFQISEVRSLLKFYFLIISKFSQGYFIVLKMTWQLLENYSQGITKIGLTLKRQTLKLNELELISKVQTSSKIVWLGNSQNLIPQLKESFIVKLWVRFPFTSFISLKTQLDPWATSNRTADSIFGNFSNSPIHRTNVQKQISPNSLIFNEISSLIQLPVFFVAKSSLILLDSTFRIMYIGIYKIIDLFETCIMLIYHFLEKPAEFIVEWIANVFLIEWSSDFLSFFPDLFDTQLWNSFSKLSRGSRVSPIVGGLIQRQFLSMTEVLLESVMKPDTDLLERQKKGILFWDIWGEILIQAAENYQMNLISLLTLKEEQDLFMEKLLEDSTWEWASPSLIKMRPLLHFLNKDGQLNQLSSSLFNPSSQIHFSLNRLMTTSSKLSADSNSILMPFQDLSDDVKGSYMDQWKRWSVNQSYTYQTKDTDLFVDFHPPKSFQHLSFLKSTPIAQQTLGPLVCQMYSGRFVNEIAKNILLVGSPGMAKTLLIQALAGETELKFMMDHSQRYAAVQQGVAVGMKALKDVFDSIALYSPCIFLLEDIHLIGSKRSMLISEQESHVNNEEIFGVEQEEIHEKNQLFYHWTRYHLAHYQRPYKSDFSVGIPTNQFCFDLFFGIQPPKARSFTPKTPLPISSIETQLMHQNLNPFEQSIESIEKAFQNFTKTNRISSLQLPKEQTVTPPATSPFLIFALKEKQTLKPRKRVKQIPWGGFSSDQMNLLPKTAYSVRIKVALLADLAMRNLSVKLDMITDLLVILDNVRSNRGFVVFATTHMPSLLDPALRRPGRFDETISLPIFPNFLNRWEIFKTHLGDFSSTCDFFDYALVTSRFNETNLLQLISETKLALFNLPDPLQPHVLEFPIRSINQSFKAITEKPILLPIRNSMNQVTLSQNPAILTSLTYFQLGMTVIRQNLLQNQNAYHTLSSVKLQQLEKPEEFLFKQFYSPTYELKNQVTQFFAGKIAQLLITNPSASCQNFYASKFYNGKNRFMISNFGGSKQYEGIGGFELFWNSATSFVSGLIHKRFLYQTNNVTSALLDFENLSLLLKPLSPPASTISMPAKKYENFQRIQKNFQQKMNLSIQEKLEIHQKQRLIRNLYQKPIQQTFRSENFSDRLTSFTNAFPELGYFDSIMLKSTSVNAYYQNRFLTRHKFSFVHQWWNGQLAEHNIESTFLSDVDWRSMFVRSIGDLVIDFPDAEQYYNPRNRRWFLNSSSWGYWLNFEKTFSEEISYHFMVQCYHRAFTYLQNQREILDYSAHLYLQEGLLKEIDFLMLQSRFYIK